MSLENGAQASAPEQQDLTAIWNAELAARAAGPSEDAPGAAETEPTDTSAEVEPTTEAAQAPTLEERLAALEAERNELKDRLHRESGRTSALQKKIDAVANAPTKAEQAKAAEDPAEWKQLMQEFPEWGTAVQKKLDAVMANIPAPSQSAPDVGNAVREALEAREFERVDRKAPGWRDTVNSPQFAAWFSAQSAEVKALAESPYGDDALQMLGLYGAASNTAKAASLSQRRDQARAVAATNGKPATPAPKASGGDIDVATAWEIEKKRRAKLRAGL